MLMRVRNNSNSPIILKILVLHLSITCEYDACLSSTVNFLVDNQRHRRRGTDVELLWTSSAVVHACAAGPGRQLKAAPHPHQVIGRLTGAGLSKPACSPDLSSLSTAARAALLMMVQLPREVSQSRRLPSMHLWAVPLWSPLGSCYFIPHSINLADQLFIIKIFMLTENE